MPNQINKDDLRDVLEDLWANGLTHDEMIEVLQEDYDITWGSRTLQRYLKEFGLGTAPKRLTEAQKQNATLLIKHYHTQRLTQSETVDMIQQQHNMPTFTKNMLKTLSKAAGLNWRMDDIAFGAITLDDLADIVMICKDRCADADAGIRRLTNIISTNVGYRINRTTINEMLRALDPDGIQLRLSGKLKRRQFECAGPNMIWASDGHDKLKPFGITIYGVIDAWSRKVLAIYVGVNNNDPRRIGVYFLRTVRKIGGIPHRTSTDHGTETLDMAQHQITLQHLFSGVPLDEAGFHHIFTTSTHNQKIEQLWSQLMKAKNHAIRDNIKYAIAQGLYNPGRELEK